MDSGPGVRRLCYALRACPQAGRGADVSEGLLRWVANARRTVTGYEALLQCAIDNNLPGEVERLAETLAEHKRDYADAIALARHVGYTPAELAP
jgi:hypothetical protein